MMRPARGAQNAAGPQKESGNMQRTHRIAAILLLAAVLAAALSFFAGPAEAQQGGSMERKGISGAFTKANVDKDRLPSNLEKTIGLLSPVVAFAVWKWL